MAEKPNPDLVDKNKFDDLLRKIVNSKPLPLKEVVVDNPRIKKSPKS